MPRSPISDSIKRVNEAIAYLQNTLNPGEIDLLLDELAPLPEPEPEIKPAKKSRKKSNKPASKSARGQSLSNAIQRTPKMRVADDDEEDERCNATLPLGGVCGAVRDDVLHQSTGYANDHEFDAGKSSVPSARERSSANGGAGSVEEEIDQAVESARV